MFKALYLQKDPEFSAQLINVEESALSPGDVVLDIEYSSMNFKDALALTNTSPIVRSWPMIAGIDAAGVVRSSETPEFKAGDRVALTSGETCDSKTGGMAQRGRFEHKWLIKLPDSISTRQSMAIGTAGFTSALSALALQKHGVKPGDGEILVTGATGGVGSVAVLILANLGYDVVACTGKLSEEDYLKSLGAKRVLDRNELSEPGKALQSPRWAGAVDTLGSHTLANICAQIHPYGAVAACGLAQGGDLKTTVMPFILRGVALIGINCIFASQELRQQAWQLMSEHLDMNLLDVITSEIGLSEAVDASQQFLDGTIKGRIVVDCSR